MKRKFKNFFKLINKQKNNYGFINTCKFIIYLIPMMALNRVQKIFKNDLKTLDFIFNNI